MKTLYFLRAMIINSPSENRNADFSRPLTAILLFLFIFLAVPFYESKRAVIWETQREGQPENIFRSIVLTYAFKAEEAKKTLGLADFFEQEHLFWLRFKKSPVVFQKSAAGEGSEEKKAIEEEAAVNLKEDAEGIAGESGREIAEEGAGEIAMEEKNEIIPAPKLESPLRILLIGDSFMAVSGGVGELLEKALLNYKDAAVVRRGKVSSGLSRPDYFNWHLTAAELISQYNPNIAVVMVGSNDAQSITTSTGEVIAFYGGGKWNEEYAGRVSNLLKIFEEKNIIVFWLGLPVMKDPAYSDRMKNLNSIYEKVVQERKNAHFISLWELFADEYGNYVSYLTDSKGKYRLARGSDGIHLSYFGGEIAIREIIKKIGEKINLESK